MHVVAGRHLAHPSMRRGYGLRGHLVKGAEVQEKTGKSSALRVTDSREKRHDGVERTPKRFMRHLSF